jgi:WD40 repeat protein
MTLHALRLTWLIACGVASAPALAQQALPPQEPILRIDAGTHDSVVNDIGVDANCKTIVTGSKDKTVRLWAVNAVSGEPPLLRTLRPPIGLRPEAGWIESVALSPDGALIALASTNLPGRPQAVLNIFDAGSGKMLLSRGVSGFISGLAFSPDGRFLAVTFHGFPALQVLQTNGWQVIAQDSAYTSNSSQGPRVTYDERGRIYTVMVGSFQNNTLLKRYAMPFAGMEIRPDLTVQVRLRLLQYRY